jgi:hypothetical protein
MAAKKHKIDAVSASSKPEKEENLEKEEVSVKEETKEAEESSEEASEEAAEKTKEADKADAEEEDSESEDEGSEEEEDEEDEEESETEPKAKKDRVPAIMVALIYAVIVAVALYYILPSVFAPSFGYTLDEYNTRLEASEISKKMMAQYTTVVPAFKLVDKNSIKEIWSIKGEIEPEEQKKLDARFKPFVKTYAATEELENILVEANTRINDGKLTRLCMYCTYDDKHMTMMMVHFGALLGNFFPEMSFNDAVSLIMNSARDANQEGLYTVKGDIAFKLAADNVGGKLYIKIEVLPAKALKPSQIKTVIHDVNESVATTPATSAS